MDTFNILVIITVTLAIVIMINLWIYYRFSKPRQHGGAINMFQKAAKRGSSPWEDEDKKLQELETLVNGLTRDTPDDE